MTINGPSDKDDLVVFFYRYVVNHSWNMIE